MSWVPAMTARMVRRVLTAIAIVALPISTVAAQQPTPLLPLPQFDRCPADTHPRLPEKWHGTFLMAPFTKAQLVLGDIVSDASVVATRVTLHGVQRGSLDLLIDGRTTYALATDGSGAPQCEDLGDTGWRPLPQDWLTEKSQCTGSAPIGDTAVDWWKTPTEPKPASDWIWYRTSDHSPFRLVFQSPNNRLAALSRFAMSYQVRFEPVSQTDLASVVSACKTARPSASKGPRALQRRIEAMARAPDRADRDIERLMSELAACSPGTPALRWPDRVAFTGLMTPFDADENPYPVEVLYDWTIPAQRTRIFARPHANLSAQDALLLGPNGYNVMYGWDRGPACTPAILPGTVRPDWPRRGPCDCMAEIEGKTPLSPFGTTWILACPLASPRAAWAWYTPTGRPLAFMVTSRRGDQGGGLFAVLDYREWLPGHRVPRAAFARPAQCSAATPLHAPAPTEAPGRTSGAASSRVDQCATCHMGRAAADRGR